MTVTPQKRPPMQRAAVPRPLSEEPTVHEEEFANSGDPSIVGIPLDTDDPAGLEGGVLTGAESPAAVVMH